MLVASLAAEAQQPTKVYRIGLLSLTFHIPMGWYPRLAHGTPAERAHVQISDAGYGMQWPELDKDIGVEGLLLGKQSTETTRSSRQGR
jgi:hypothetical protein